MAAEVSRSSGPDRDGVLLAEKLRPCSHQVAGHLFEEGKAGSLVDDRGHFYKPLQVGPRGRREREFYENVAAALRAEAGGGGDCGASCASTSSSGAGGEPASACGELGACDDCCDDSAVPPFSERHATMLQAVPRFFGVHELPGRMLLELEDVASRYSHPSIIDIKVGFQTWYPSADQRYIEKCKIKDAETTQAAIGFKICGMQVYRHVQRGYWRCSKRWCKKMPEAAVDKALWRFAHNEGGLTPGHVYGGASGALEQLHCLERWFARQREWAFYSSSILIIYEGAAESADEANVSVRLVDFAHTFPSAGRRDDNFLAGLRALTRRLSDVMRADISELAL